MQNFNYSNNLIYNTKSYLINYNGNNFRILKLKYCKEKGFEKLLSFEELINNFVGTTKNTTNKETSLEKSLIRTKSHIRELAMSNDFDYFGTITLNGYFCSRYELTDAQNLLKKQLRNIRRSHSKDTDFKYLIITEKHKDNAFHFHGLFSGLELITNEFGYLYSPTLSKLGYNSFTKIKNHTAVSNYITKYITKDCVKNSTNQIYFRSRNLIRATKEEIDTTFMDLNKCWKYENDFCCIYDYNLERLNETDKKILYEILKR